MKIEIIGSTKAEYKLSKSEALDFSGKSAGICYLPDSLEKLFLEPKEKTEKRVNMNLKSGHHSVFGHCTYNLSMENVPKIIAMILNNEKKYNTSEKSARYTIMKLSGKEEELYNKWINIYSQKIKEVYPNFEDKKIKKLAQENARYLISVFTPSTVMEYTVDFQQLNFIMHWFEDYINNEENNVFSNKLKPYLQEFINELSDLYVENLDSHLKNRKLSLFAQKISRKEEFGENYCTTYLASFAELAQAQRHRTLIYEMSLLDEPQYYIPKIIKSTQLEMEWIKDISSLSENFPQGMLVKINERGTLENFVLKCTERLCGAAQLEIMDQTLDTLKKYIVATEDDFEIHNYLLNYSKGARCTFPGWKCESPCIFGGKGAITRLI